MKKTTRISVPRRVVLPLAAAALLTACDERSPGTYKTTHATPTKSGSATAAKGRSASSRTVDGMWRRYV